MSLATGVLHHIWHVVLIPNHTVKSTTSPPPPPKPSQFPSLIRTLTSSNAPRCSIKHGKTNIRSLVFNPPLQAHLAVTAPRPLKGAPLPQAPPPPVLASSHFRTLPILGIFPLRKRDPVQTWYFILHNFSPWNVLIQYKKCFKKSSRSYLIVFTFLWATLLFDTAFLTWYLRPVLLMSQASTLGQARQYTPSDQSNEWKHL